MNLYIFYRLAQIIIRKLPRPFAYWAGMRIADCFYLFDRRGRHAVSANLRQILLSQSKPIVPARIARMTRRNFEHFGKYLVDFFRFARLTPDEVRNLIDMEGFEYLDKALAYGRGVIIITAHFGNWELGAAAVTSLGYQLSAVFQPESSGNVNRLFQQHRAGRGIHGIALGQAARSVIKVLKSKGIAAMPADRDFSPHNQPIDFFNAPARLPSGPARLAFKTGAVVLPCFLSRKPDDHFLMRFYPPVVSSECASVDEIRTRIRDILEIEIGRMPLQWFMFEQFWRKRETNQ